MWGEKATQRRTMESINPPVTNARDHKQEERGGQKDNEAKANVNVYRYAIGLANHVIPTGLFCMGSEIAMTPGTSMTCWLARVCLPHVTALLCSHKSSLRHSQRHAERGTCVGHIENCIPPTSYSTWNVPGTVPPAPGRGRDESPRHHAINIGRRG